MISKKEDFIIKASFFTIIVLLLNCLPFVQEVSSASDYIIYTAFTIAFNIGVVPLFLAMASKHKSSDHTVAWMNTILFVVFSSILLINEHTSLSFGTSLEVRFWIMYAGSLLALIANTIMYLIRNKPFKK